MRLDQELQRRHDRNVESLQQSVLDYVKQGKQPQASKREVNSHLMRPKRQFGGLRLNLNEFKHVLKIDVEHCLAVVEPKVTMEQLVDATLPYGLIPPVVAEFKNITVGGAIMGTSLESSSHQKGQFNDTCLAYTLLLGDGSIVRATPENYPDLFYGISGSFGSLGVLLSVEIRLIPSTGWLKLSYARLGSVQEAIDSMGKLHRSDQPPPMLEGLAFGKDHVVVVNGSPEIEKETQDSTEEDFSMRRYWSPWFYQVLRSKTAHLPSGTFKKARMPIKDYLFRYDRGAFWMGTYALQGTLLARFILDNWFGTPAWLANLSYDRHAQLKDPGLLFRFLWGWLCSSTRLYSILHKGSEGWFAKKAIIQDFYLPEKQAAAFADQALHMSSITPLWLCPIKTASQDQFLAPHAIEGDLAFDVGVYGFPKASVTPPELTLQLELLGHKLGGRKMLYSYSFFSEEEFWRIYPKERYEALRRKYHAEGVFADITEKVLQKP